MSEPSIPVTRPPTPDVDEDPRLRAYRDWALQSASLTVFDAGTAWRGRPAALGLGEPGESGDRVRGQGELMRELEPVPDAGVRAKTLLLLGAGGLLSLLVNQYANFGDPVDRSTFAIAVTGIVATMLVIAIAVPRITGRALFVGEQSAMVAAWTVVALLVARTGGAESPYAVWWLFPVFYAAYFLAPRAVLVNTSIVSLLAIAPLAYGSSSRDAGSLFETLMLLGVIWVLHTTLILGRARAREAERGVRYLALADPLTGVANLRAIERLLDRAVRSDAPRFAVVLADMRGLKGANASFGYEVGDDMLRRLAAVMLHVSGEPDQVARVRGDEFVVVIPDAGPEEAERWSARLERALEDHNTWIRNRLPQLSVSLGAACFPRDGVRPKQLFEAADRRMLEQKTLAVKPPYEVDLSVGASAAQLLSAGAETAEPETTTRTRPMIRFDVRWLAGAILFAAWALTAGSGEDTVTALLGLASFCFAFAFAGFFVRGRRAVEIFTQASDLATMGVLVPGMWLTGGWDSPLQLASFFPIAYYAQFARGREALTRIAAVVALYSVGFWGAEAVGASPGPPSDIAETEFAMIVIAQLIIASLLQYNRRVTDAAIRRIRDAATHDPLTSALNLRAFRGALTEAIAAAAEPSAAQTGRVPGGVAGGAPRPALVIADIDGFREVNNLGGHVAGDAVLRETADRLKSLAGAEAGVYRIDSDEFAVIFKAGDPSRCEKLVEEVRSALDPLEARISGIGRPVRVSVGGALWRGGTGAEALVDAARASLDDDRRSHSSELSGYGGETLL